MELNRRDFLKGALTVGALGAGAGLVGCSAPASSEGTAVAETGGTVYPAGLQESDFAESPVEIEPITEFSEEKTYDVVVVGAGTGGVPAALSALEEGATVAVLQKESKPISQGGTCSGVLLDESDEQGVLTANLLRPTHAILAKLSAGRRFAPQKRASRPTPFARLLLQSMRTAQSALAAASCLARSPTTTAP